MCQSRLIIDSALEQDDAPRIELLIGAPKARTIGYNNSGAVYSCPLSTYRADCTQLLIDQNIHLKNRVIKNDQWLGVTVQSGGPGSYVMSCAHRYILAGEDYQWGQGICYSLTQDLHFGRAWEPCQNRPVNKAHEQYGYCQAGTSGLITEDNTIVIGTPGPFTWRGTVFTNSVSFKIKDDKRWYFGPLLEETSPVDKYSYLGMSVTSGNFFNGKRSFVSGAPRSNGTGQVVFFAKNRNDVVFEVQLILHGEKFASSFGYSLTSIDINSDGYVDLVVGAPFYFDKGKGGAIYIYMNSPDGISENAEPIKITGKPESRFGFAVENAGDLNQDGFPDLAVGAPYEEGGGAVYIYSGSEDGIIIAPSQVIQPENLKKSGSLQTFGYSINGRIDIDDNSYPDLLIGCYESNAAVLLRSRPVLDIVTSVTGQFSNIDPDKKGCEMDRSAPVVCFSFEACFQFNSTLSSVAQKLKYKIEAETFTGRKYYRVRFKSSLDGDTPNIVEKEITLKGSSFNRKHCSQEIVYLKDKSDIQNPVQFKLTYSLIQKDPVQPIPGAALPDVNDYPILNQQEASKIFEAKFLKDCGTNDICESALDVVVDINLKRDEQGKPVLYLGEKQLALSVKVTNTKEPAYDAMLYVFHPASLSYVGRKIVKGDQIECVPFNSTVTKCELGNPLKKNEVELLIRFNPKDIASDDRSLKLSVKVNTTSVDENVREDTVIETSIVKLAELEIRGASQPEQAFYGGDSSKVPVYVDDIGNEVVHIYEIINHGPWLATGVEVVVSWPYESIGTYEHGKWLLYIVENPEIIGNGYCQLDATQLNPLKLQRHPEELRLASASSYRRRVKRGVEPQELRMEGKIVKVVNLDCEKGTAKCFQFECFFRSIERGSTAIVRIKARLWNSTFVTDYPSVDWVTINSNAHIRAISDDIRQTDEVNDYTTAETKAYPDIALYQKSEEVALWIIILAACAGILLLIILILILWKCGFFKRKKPGYQPAPTHEKEYM
ncbi:integrin alpha-PS1 [Caerostris darwini]|uniref:Integrin alpha-PS1 n=1 Tax=Caerostris darwini TaxID=1538125 RepID=A0AAV4RNF1_9ARAC|nr:integrin alpha-PS1 [Caerostris darwini]